MTAPGHGYGDGMPGALLAPIIVVVILLVLVAFAMKRFSRRTVEHSDRLQYADRPTVRYEVPNGQDPANVLIHLREAGFDASPDSEPGPSSPVIIIGTKTGDEPDRERLRAVLAQTSVNVDPSVDSPTEERHSTVRFLDE
jgi:hypothetical protein